MNKNAMAVAALALTALLSAGPTTAQKAPAAPKGTSTETDSAYPFRLFETSNIWAFILLNTATGRAWQVNYSLSDSPVARLVVNGDSLLPEGATPRNGRFTLYPTNNMYTFLLLDREDSRLWQIQWSLDSEKRGIVRMLPMDR